MRGRGFQRLVRQAGVALLIVATIGFASLAVARRPSASAQTEIHYAHGWNLISGPTGSIVRGALDPLYTLDAGQTDYTPVPASTPLLGCRGYWAYFPSPTGGSLALPNEIPINGAVVPGTGNDYCRRTVAPYQFLLVGNPSATATITLDGINILETYDPVVAATAASGTESAGWTNDPKAVLLPGQGALIQGGQSTINGLLSSMVVLLPPTTTTLTRVFPEMAPQLSNHGIYDSAVFTSPGKNLRIVYDLRDQAGNELTRAHFSLKVFMDQNPNPIGGVVDALRSGQKDVSLPNQGKYFISIDSPDTTNWTITVYSF